MTSFLRKSLVGGAAALTLVGAVASSTAPALARQGGAVAAGVIGGLALGAIAGSAAANANRYGAYGPGYGPAYDEGPAYADPGYGGGCYFTRQPVYDEYGEVVGHRRVRVCE